MNRFKILVSATVLSAGLLTPPLVHGQDTQVIEGLVKQEEQSTKNRAAAKAEFTAKLSKAQAGDAQAQYDVGLTYALPLLGQVEPDAAQAFQWFLRSAQQAYLPAQQELGFRYASGEGVEKNLTQAFQWHQRAAEKGSRKSQLELASAYASGAGVRAQPEKALAIYQRFEAEPDNPDKVRTALALLSLYQKHYPNDHQNILRWMETAYDRGAHSLGRDLVQAYSEGKLAPPNAAKLRRYLEDRLKQPNMKSADLYLLASLYETGRGGPKDSKRANAWFTQLAQAGYPDAVLRSSIQQKLEAAQQGDAQAQYDVGVAYSKKTGQSAQDLEQAKYWLEKSAQQGHRQAQGVLATLSASRSGEQAGSQDADAGASMEETLAKQGDADSQLKMYEHYRRMDPAKAWHWLSAAADQGHADAQFKKGFALSNGLLRQKRDPDAGLRWYRAAAEQNHPVAMYQVGRAYEKGEGIEPDPGKALLWYQKAADQGVKEAAQRLRELKQS